VRAVQAVSEAVSEQELERHLEWAQAAHRLFEAYGVSSFSAAVRALEVALGAEEEEESDSPVSTAASTAAVSSVAASLQPPVQYMLAPNGMLAIKPYAPPTATLVATTAGDGNSGISSGSGDSGAERSAAAAAAAAAPSIAAAEYAAAALAVAKMQQHASTATAAAADHATAVEVRF
jgi:hypothetical protein